MDLLGRRRRQTNIKISRDFGISCVEVHGLHARSSATIWLAARPFALLLFVPDTRTSDRTGMMFEWQYLKAKALLKSFVERGVVKTKCIAATRKGSSGNGEFLLRSFM